MHSIFGTSQVYINLFRHDLAMKYAKIGSKIHYNMIFDTIILCYGIVLKYLHESKYYKTPKDKRFGSNVNLDEELITENFIELPEVYNRLVNVISILHYLIDMTQDMKFELLSRHKETILNAQLEALEKYGKLKLQVNLDDFMNEMIGHEWILKNKILNQVQMDNVKREEYL
jgi:hypothetical protein